MKKHYSKKSQHYTLKNTKLKNIKLQNIKLQNIKLQNIKLQNIKLQNRFLEKPIVSLLVIILLVTMISGIQFAQVPTPHGIAGTIYHNDGSTQVSLGTPFRVNDSNSTDFIQDVTSVPVPSFSGRYSVSIDGTDRDTVIAHSWNKTNYGETKVILISDMDNIDIILNKTRQAEPNITITAPPDHSEINTSGTFVLNVSITILGGVKGVNCSVSLNISNSNVFNPDTGETYQKQLGNISLGEEKNVSFNITALIIGKSNFSASSRCYNSNVFFDNDYIDTIYNITSNAGGGESMTITLKKPANNTLNMTSHNISFSYSVTHTASLNNCTLYINSVANKTKLLPALNVVHNESIILPNGNYNWSVNCTDSSDTTGFSGTFNFTVNLLTPYISTVTTIDPFDLTIGSLATMICNATVHDINGIDQLVNVNATFFDSTKTTSGEEDNNNWHYSNDSCSFVSSAGTEANYTCSFNVWYYAYNGSWNCNVTVVDITGLKNHTSKKAVINSLVAIGANTTINYGTILPGNVSDEVNLTIYNFGNQAFNVSVKGFAVNDLDNLSMICATGQNIGVGFERYSPIPLVPFATKTNLSSSITLIPNFNMPKRVNELSYDNDKNTTFWSIYAPKGLKTSSCNGSIQIFATI